MRGMVAALASPHPLAETLPSLLREDPFARQPVRELRRGAGTGAADLGHLRALPRPGTTPEDMIPWLAQWLGLGVDLNVEQARQRHELQIAGVAERHPRHPASIETGLENALGIRSRSANPGVRAGRRAPGGRTARRAAGC